jgi:hypothetical protein
LEIHTPWRLVATMAECARVVLRGDLREHRPIQVAGGAASHLERAVAIDVDARLRRNGAGANHAQQRLCLELPRDEWAQIWVTREVEQAVADEPVHCNHLLKLERTFDHDERNGKSETTKSP